MNAATLLDRARSLLRSGDPRQAEALCRQILQDDATHFQAWLLLGLALQPQNRHTDAADALSQATRLDPKSCEAYLSLGRSLAALSRRPEAAEAFRAALSLRPTDPEAPASLGLALAELGRLGEAIAYLREAVRLSPNQAGVRHNLGVALAQSGDPQGAARELQEALRIDPNYSEACYNLGNVLGQMNRRDEAIAQYRRAVKLKPTHAGALNNLGLALTQSGKPEEATILLRQAVRLQPGLKEGHNNLGLAFTDLGRFGEAEACHQEALRLDPMYSEGHSNLGNAYKEQGRTEEALACYELALTLDPDSASTRYNRSLALLQAGRYEEGWREYEWRWKRPKAGTQRMFRQPRWDGSSLEGRTILLWCEQGLGDTIQFVRYATLVKAKGDRVVLECPGCLVPLLATCPGVDQVLAEGEALSAFDVQAPLLSLPAILGTTLGNVPAEAPYLSAEVARVEKWRERLAGLSGLRVGVVWQGNRHHQWDRHRSFRLEALAPLAAVARVSLVSLQKGPGAEQLKKLRGRFAVADLGEELDAQPGTFLDTAAVMRSLDLVVSADTAAAHLAGALGVPVWLALATISDWRWLLGREDTPWYPTMRLFRCGAGQPWASVFDRLAASLRHWVEERNRGGLVHAEMSAGEALDKLTILEIKAQRFADPRKVGQVRAELVSLKAAWDREIVRSEELARLATELKVVNEALWEVEDALRQCERQEDFGGRFVELARSVYRHNDKRAALKRRVNEAAGAPWGEQKEYAGGLESRCAD